MTEGAAELGFERGGARIAMRLKHHQHATAEPACRGERGANLGGMMPVVVDHAHASRFAARLEAAAHAAEPRQRLGDQREAHLDLETDRDRRQRVQHVVVAGHVQFQRTERASERLDLKARAMRQQLHVARAHLALLAGSVARVTLGDRGQNLAHLRVVGAHNAGAIEGHAIRKVGERLTQSLDIAEVIQMLAVDVGDHRDRRRQAQERAVALVGFGHQELAMAELGIGADAVQPPADHDGRIETAARQYRADHRSGGGLAVRTADRDAVLHAHQFGQHVGARNHRHAGGTRGLQFGVLLAHRGRVHHQLRIRDVGGVVTDHHAAAEPHQPVGGLARAQIAARDLIAEIDQHLGDPGHSGAADADQVDVTRSPVHLSVPLPRRR